MKGMTMTQDAVMVHEGTEIAKYNHAENVSAIKDDIDFIRSKNAEYAVRIGKRLLLAKENVPHGKWLETLEEIDFTPRTAENLMKIAETFGDQPDMLIGMSQRRALMLAALPDENLISTKREGLVHFPDGTTCSLDEYTSLQMKDVEARMANLRNQKNAENREYKDKASNLQAELDATRRQAEEQTEFTRQLMQDKDAAFADRLEKLTAMVGEKDAELSKMRLELMQMQGAEAEEQEIMTRIADAKRAIDDVFFMTGNLQVTPERATIFRELMLFADHCDKTVGGMRFRLSKQADIAE